MRIQDEYPEKKSGSITMMASGKREHGSKSEADTSKTFKNAMLTSVERLTLSDIKKESRSDGLSSMTANGGDILSPHVCITLSHGERFSDGVCTSDENERDILMSFEGQYAEQH